MGTSQLFYTTTNHYQKPGFQPSHGVVPREDREATNFRLHFHARWRPIYRESVLYRFYCYCALGRVGYVRSAFIPGVRLQWKRSS